MVSGMIRLYERGPVPGAWHSPNRGHKVALLCVEIDGRCEIDLDSVLRFGSRNFGLEITMGREYRHVAGP